MVVTTLWKSHGQPKDTSRELTLVPNGNPDPTPRPATGPAPTMPNDRRTGPTCRHQSRS